MGHLNHVVDDYAKARALYGNVFGADIFREWDEPHAGSANALLLVADTCLELFGVNDPDGVVGRWASRHGQGWHSLEWTLPSFEQAVEVTSALGIALTERVEGAYLFTHPRDCHGICLELTAAHFADDARDVQGWEPTYWRDEHPLGIDGSPCIRVSSHGALDAARWLASLTGREVDYDERRPQLVGRAVGVHLAGHSIEFVEPEAEGPLSRFLEARGERIHSVSLPVRDLSSALGHLEDMGVGVLPGQDGSRFIDPVATCGGLVELRQS